MWDQRQVNIVIVMYRCRAEAIILMNQRHHLIDFGPRLPKLTLGVCRTDKQRGDQQNAE
jgi:hypothetical protein